jgi:demethylmenaquinone methyltransferase/2-methoxy-6-polyprenyl-1,4-benzoquinol methylase
MDDKQKSRKYFDGHSSTFVNRNGYWNYDYRLTSRILKKRNVKKLVDIGCGNGAFLEMFHKLSPGTKLAGLDLSYEMVLRSRERLPEADITEGDAEKMPFEDGAFDAVSCHMSIHHHPHPEKSLAEMYRILGNNGTVVINELTGPKWLRRFMNWCFTKWPTGDHAVYSRAEMEQMLHAAGFQNIRSRMITPFTYVSVGRKREGKPAMIKLVGLSDEQVTEERLRPACGKQSGSFCGLRCWLFGRSIRDRDSCGR